MPTHMDSGGANAIPWNRIPERDPVTFQWHFDVPQGSNNGTVLPFSSRTVDTNGNPVKEQILAKPQTDLSEGVLDWQHDAPFGDLFHLTAGPHISGGAALIAMGLDNGSPIGLFINNKGTAVQGIGIKIEQNSTINTATGAYGFQIDQMSPTSPAMFLHQTDGAAPLMLLFADTAITGTTTALIQVTAAGATQGYVRAKTGEIYWQADVITHDGGGFLNIAQGVSADSNQTKQLSDGFNLRAFSGTAGIYYPGRISRASAGLKIDVAPNTSGGPNWTGVAWQTGLTVKPGTAQPATLLGVANRAVADTEGYPYMPVVAGQPTGAPSAQTGFVPFAYDTTNNKLWIYNGGWKGAVLS